MAAGAAESDPDLAPRSQRDSFGDYFSWPQMRLFGLFYLISISNGAVMAIALVGLFAWSLTGTTQALMAMALVALLRFSNGAVAHFAPGAAVLFWLIAMAASVRLYLGARRLSGSYLLLLAFALVAALLSAMVSKAVDVSLMKVVSFFITSSALLIAAESLQAVDALRLQRWFFSVALVMAVLAIATIPFPGIAFRKVAGSLQGMFSHPQTTGVFFAPFAAWFIAKIFLEQARALPRWVFGVAFLFAALIVASRARTAMLATFVAVGITLLTVLIRGKTGPTSRSRGQVIGFTVVMFVLSIVILLSGVLDEELKSIVLKGDDEESVSEAFESARGAGVSSQIDNFSDAPLTGWGFGVYREGVRGGEKNIKRFMGIPISASAEKGVVFTSVLEETGLFGGMLFYALLISIIARAAKANNPGVPAMATATIAVNFGEAIIFAAGGMGLFMWTLIAFALARARVRDVDQRGSGEDLEEPADRDNVDKSDLPRSLTKKDIDGR